MNDAMKLNENDFNDLIEAVSLWGKETLDTNDAAANVFANIISGSDRDKTLKFIAHAQSNPA